MTVSGQVKLSELPDDAFNSIVNQDVRGTLSNELSEMLRDPALAERWYDSLQVLKRSVESQLSANKAERAQKIAEYDILGPGGTAMWVQARVSTEKWRSGAVRFKNGVEDRLTEARRSRNQSRADMLLSIVITERNEALTEVRKLRTAIIGHREHTCDSECIEECIADEQLWTVLESPHELKVSA